MIYKEIISIIIIKFSHIYFITWIFLHSAVDGGVDIPLQWPVHTPVQGLEFVGAMGRERQQNNSVFPAEVNPLDGQM